MTHKDTNTIIDPLTGQPIAVGEPISAETADHAAEGQSVELTVDQPTQAKKERKAATKKATAAPKASEDSAAEEKETAADTDAPEKQKETQQIEAKGEALTASIKKAIKEQAREDERAHSASLSLMKILGGDILSSQIFRQNVWLMILIAVFVVIYISMRYSVQKELLEMDQLYSRLDDAKYRALSSSSQLTEECRESHVLHILKNSKDSVIKMAEQPPYIINVPNN